MTRTVICLVLLAAMTAAGIALDIHTGYVTEEVSVQLEELAKKPDAETARAISESWERFCADNVFLVNNECAFEISKALVHITTDIGDGDDVSEECRETLMLIDIYDESRRLSLANVF